MSPALRTVLPLRRQLGHAAVEYTVIVALLGAILFAPQSPAGRMLADSLHRFYFYLSLYISLP